MPAEAITGMKSRRQRKERAAAIIYDRGIRIHEKIKVRTEDGHHRNNSWTRFLQHDRSEGTWIPKLQLAQKENERASHAVLQKSRPRSDRPLLR